MWTMAEAGGRKWRLAFQKSLQNPKEWLKPLGKPLTLHPQGDEETSATWLGHRDLPQQSKQAAALASGLSGRVLLGSG